MRPRKARPTDEVVGEVLPLVLEEVHRLGCWISLEDVRAKLKLRALQPDGWRTRSFDEPRCSDRLMAFSHCGHGDFSILWILRDKRELEDMLRREIYNAFTDVTIAVRSGRVARYVVTGVDRHGVRFEIPQDYESRCCSANMFDRLLGTKLETVRLRWVSPE